MGFIDIFATAVSITCGFLANHFLGNPKYWNILIVIGLYLVINFLFHLAIRRYCRPFKSGTNPKHLVVIVTGFLGHYSRLISIQDAFKKYHDNMNDDDVMVYLARNANTGFFFWTFWKSNDGIHKGGIRLSNEIKSIITKHPSIDKLSFISCSLGGLYSRYCLKHLYDAENMHTINGRNVQPINYISLASPHLGTKDWVQLATCCCTCIPCYGLAKVLCKGCLLTSTLAQLLFLDKEQLLVQMASDTEFLMPLQAFKNKVCFGNAKYDAMVSCPSALMLYGNQCKIGERFWEKMMCENGKALIEELKGNDEEMNVVEFEEADEEKEDVCWFERLREMEWKKVIVCWNQNKCARDRSHDLLAAPFLCYSGCTPLYDTLFQNFKYN